MATSSTATNFTSASGTSTNAFGVSTTTAVSKQKTDTSSTATNFTSASGTSTNAFGVSTTTAVSTPTRSRGGGSRSSGGSSTQQQPTQVTEQQPQQKQAVSLIDKSTVASYAEKPNFQKTTGQAVYIAPEKSVTTETPIFQSAIGETMTQSQLIDRQRKQEETTQKQAQVIKNFGNYKGLGSDAIKGIKETGQATARTDNPLLVTGALVAGTATTAATIPVTIAATGVNPVLGLATVAGLASINNFLYGYAGSQIGKQKAIEKLTPTERNIYEEVKALEPGALEAYKTGGNWLTGFLTQAPLATTEAARTQLKKAPFLAKDINAREENVRNYVREQQSKTVVLNQLPSLTGETAVLIPSTKKDTTKEEEILLKVVRGQISGEDIGVVAGSLGTELGLQANLAKGAAKTAFKQGEEKIGQKFVNYELVKSTTVAGGGEAAGQYLGQATGEGQNMNLVNLGFNTLVGAASAGTYTFVRQKLPGQGAKKGFDIINTPIMLDEFIADTTAAALQKQSKRIPTAGVFTQSLQGITTLTFTDTQGTQVKTTEKGKSIIFINQIAETKPETKPKPETQPTTQQTTQPTTQTNINNVTNVFSQTQTETQTLTQTKTFTNQNFIPFLGLPGIGSGSGGQEGEGKGRKRSGFVNELNVFKQLLKGQSAVTLLSGKPTKGKNKKQASPQRTVDIQKLLRRAL